jgi:hypothetical protein
MKERMPGGFNAEYRMEAPKSSSGMVLALLKGLRG